MVSQSLLNNTNVQVTSALGGMQVLEYVQDMSVSPSTSKLQYYMSRMNVNKRQLLLNLNGNGYTVQAGAMQWTAGQIQMESGVKGVGGFLSGMAKARRYQRDGCQAYLHRLWSGYVRANLPSHPAHESTGMGRQCCPG